MTLLVTHNYDNVSCLRQFQCNRSEQSSGWKNVKDINNVISNYLWNNKFAFQVSKIDDISLTMTFELYMDLMWEESRIIINETSPYWGPDGSFMGSTNFVPKMWLPDIQIYMCKQFRKRQIVTDVAGLIIFKDRRVLYTVSTEVLEKMISLHLEQFYFVNLSLVLLPCSLFYMGCKLTTKYPQLLFSTDKQRLRPNFYQYCRITTFDKKKNLVYFR